jgi:hypothetical protein
VTTLNGGSWTGTSLGKSRQSFYVTTAVVKRKVCFLLLLLFLSARAYLFAISSARLCFLFNFLVFPFRLLFPVTASSSVTNFFRFLHNVHISSDTTAFLTYLFSSLFLLTSLTLTYILSGARNSIYLNLSSF